MRNFHAMLAEIPFNANGTNATGILAPIMRATGHILYAVGALAEPGYVLTDEEVQNELTHAALHLANTTETANLAPISARAKERITSFCELVLVARDEYTEWPEDDRGANLRGMADRAAALATLFDFELAGLSDSNPGTTV